MSVLAIWLHDPQAISMVRENDPLPIGRKFWGIETAKTASEALQLFSIDADGMNVKPTAFLRDKIDCLSVR